MDMQTGAAEARLNEAEIAQYNEKGWIVPKWEIPQDTIAKMREEYDRLLAANPDLGPDLIMAPHQENGGSMNLKGGSRSWLDFATQPALMEIARQLMGEDIILWGTTLFGKPPHNGKETPWHQDGEYYPIRPLETLTMWIPLDDVTPQNGPMSYIPGSHKAHDLFKHSWQDNPEATINLVADDTYFNEADAEALVIRAGQVSFHDIYMIHGSTANRTDKRRAAFIVRLMPASSFYDHALGAETGKKHLSQGYGVRPLYLVNGQDRAGNNFTIGHEPPKDA